MPSNLRWKWLSGYREEFLKLSTNFHFFAITCIYYWIPFIQSYIVPFYVKIGHSIWFWSIFIISPLTAIKKSCEIVVPLGTNLKFLSPRKLCAKFGWNRPCGSGKKYINFNFLAITMYPPLEMWVVHALNRL